MKIGSLFSGIGGFELGLQTGIPGASVAWQVEIDPYCRNVLARHWPDAERSDDVREVGARNLAPVDILCGGFPCQDISVAGAGAGLAGARSGLWFQMLRIIEELRPRYVIAENVAALRTRGLDIVIAGLRDAGYVASWSIVGAADLGAPHRRNRMWIVAYRRDVEPAYAPRVTYDDRAACMRDVWPRDGGDPEAWERGEPRTMPARTGNNRRQRLQALGNAVVPQIPAMIGRQLVGGFSLSSPVFGEVAPYLPPPTVCGNHNRKGASANSGDGLAAAVKVWPTPRAAMDAGSHSGGTVDSLHAAVKVCPTPRLNTGASTDAKHLSLDGAVRVWPTPTAHIVKEGGHPGEHRRNEVSLTAQAINDPSARGTLSPRWVELLMGYPLDWTVA